MPKGKEAGQLANRPVGSADRLKIQGNLEIEKSAPPEERRAGATRKFEPLVKPEGEDPGRPGDEATGKPDGARPGATREIISRSRKIRESGQPEERIVGDTEGPGFGATWRSVSRHRRRMRDSRRLGTPSPAKPEVQNEGQPEDCIRSAAGGVRKRGNSPNHLNRQRGRHARVGATRGSMAGTTEGLKGRGNPELRRRRGSRL